MSGKIYCLYHSNCSDGLGAAWAVWKRYPDAIFHAVTFGRRCPILFDLKEEDTVIIADFSYDYPDMDEIRRGCKRLIFLDHHHRSEKICEDLKNNFSRPQDSYIYDATRSGAKMAWMYFHNRPAPTIIEVISDRDLWTFEYPNTRDVMTGMQQYPLDLKVWKTLPLESPEFISQLIADSVPLRRQYDTFRDTVIQTTNRTIKLANYVVPLINCPVMFASEALAILAEEHPFAVGYFDTRGNRLFSLRSRKIGGVNVREVAESFGGGGHDNASGFKVPRNHPLAKL